LSVVPLRRESLAGVADEVLAARVAKREVAAWSSLYDRYAPGVYALAAHLLGRDQAEEIVQDSFLRLWQKAGLFDPRRGSFRGWFFGVVRHRIQDELRHRSREERLLVAGEVAQLLAEAVDPQVDVEEAVARRERGSAVLHALQRLPAEQRSVLVLAYFGGGLSQVSIAEYLGCPLGTVKKRTSLGLGKLRALLCEHEHEREPAERMCVEGAAHEL
jgi:RNA polymerase sigma-70 factor (ECF subfamily)